MKQHVEDQFFARLEAARYLRMAPRTLDKFVLRGDIPAYKLDRKVLFKRSELDAFVACHRVCSLNEVVDEVLREVTGD